MYLDKLTINGFKSFADEIELVFEPGITTIVGPNGCGKSNISDAIKWVLGEQSTKSLRCNRMSELIFNGGTKSNPLKKAEVALKFNGVNGDFRSKSEAVMQHDSGELLIGRQVSQTGESEYYMNKEQCLLKELNELFMGTGIGTDAYSIMEQSKIDLVLNTRPEERRFLFDEVAGITKYKHRRKKAEKKLEETKQNILRIDDIISELERETESLRVQAERAQKYAQLKDKLKEFEFALGRSQYDEIIKQISDTKVELNETRKKISELEASIEKREANLESVKSNQKDLDDEIEGCQTQIHTLENKIEKTESRITLYKERQSNIQKQRQRAEENIAEMEKQLDEFDKQRQAQEKEKQQIETVLGLDESKLNARQRVLEKLDKRIEQVKQKISETNTQVDKVVEEFTELRGENSNLQNQLKYSASRLDKLTEDLDQMRTEFSAATGRLLQSEEELNELKNKIVQSVKEQKTVQGAIRKKKKTLRELESKTRQMQDKLGQRSSRLRSLRGLQQNYEGYYAGVRAVLLAKENKPDEFAGICGVVAEIIQTEPDYELAIEVALGSAIQNIIVETSEDAQKSISFLKRTKSGRATFLPLDIIQPRVFRDSDAILEKPGVLGLAHELLEYDYKYNKAIRRLLGNTLVVADFDVAIGLRRNQKVNARLVTLEGERIRASGAITGGHSKSMASGLLQRTREIEELEQVVSRLSEQMSEFNTQRDKLEDDIASSREHLEELNESTHSLKLEYAEEKKEFEQQEEQQEWLKEQIKSAEDEKNSIEQEKDTIEDDQLEIREKLEEREEEKHNLQRQIKRLKEEMSIEMEKREEVKQSYTELRIELVEKRERIQSIDNAIKSIKANKLQAQERIRKFKNDIESDEEIREELKERIAQAQHEFLLLEQKKFDESEKFSKLKSDHADLLKKINSGEKEIRSLRRKLRKSNKAEHKLDVKITQLKMQKNSIREKILDRYNKSIEQIVRQVKDTMDEEELNSEIDKLKAQIDEMGNVNLMAIDEYDEHKKRLEFMTSERDDLKKSMNDIYKTIDKINKVSKQEFKESFEKIKANFQDTFERLFGGGEASLSLTDEDLLEAGIEITARPPGKKPKSISALSGGERTLVAIALLFAIFKLKPSPFCVLDEVDAALDDANVIRFTNLLKDFAEQTQFIVITHNKRTMEIADVMYGITMEDAGISKLVSLKL